MGVLSTLAAQFAQHKIIEMEVSRRQRVAKKAERAKVDKIHSRGSATKSKSIPITSSQKASSRRKSIMKRAAPAESGYQRLLKTLSGKKSSKGK